MRAQGRKLRRDIAERDALDAFRAPALPARELPHHPIGLRADAGDACELVLEIGDAMDWAAGQYAKRDAERRPCLFGDAEDRRAFGDEGHPRSRADADIHRAGGKSLLQLGVSGKSRDFDVEPVLFEYSFRDADIDGGELEQRGEALAEAQRLGRAGRRVRDENSKRDEHGRSDGAADQSVETHHSSLYPARRRALEAAPAVEPAS